MAGSLAEDPALIMLNMLDDLSLAGYPDDGQTDSDWPMFVGVFPDNPDQAILLTNTAGVDKGRFMVGGEHQEDYGVTISVRAAKQSTAFDKAKAIKDALNETVLRTSVTIGSNVYEVQAVTTTPGPIYAGKEEASQRKIFTVNAVVDVRQTA